MIEIIDNFLNFDVFKEMQEIVFSNYFPWHWSKILSDADYKKSASMDSKYNYQLFHILYANHRICSDFYESFIPVLEALGIRSLIRMKFNLNPITSNIIKHGFHCDYVYDGSKTAVLYFNTNDGYTEFEKEKKIVESLENRIVIFDSKLRHTGTTCTNDSKRIVLNLNYF